MNDIEMDLFELDGIVSGLTVAASTHKVALKANREWLESSRDRLTDILQMLDADGRRLER